jgi:hypothetical protein
MQHIKMVQNGKMILPIMKIIMNKVKANQDLAIYTALSVVFCLLASIVFDLLSI